MLSEFLRAEWEEAKNNFGSHTVGMINLGFGRELKGGVMLSV